MAGRLARQAHRAPGDRRLVGPPRRGDPCARPRASLGAARACRTRGARAAVGRGACLGLGGGL
eukprot:1506590-Pyramimonas_sp.AAC.1